MRKIALLTMPLLILGLFAASADVMVNNPVTATVSGNSTLTWGIDLDTGATGFKNAHEANLEVTIVPEATTDSGMMDTDDLYAHIKLENFKWVANKDGAKTTAPGVTTTLFMGPFSIKTFAGPTVKVDYVDTVDGGDDNGKDKEDEFPGADFEDVETKYDGIGMTVAYKLDPVKLSLGVVSENDWTQDGPGDKDKLACHTHGDDDAVTACKEEDKDNRNDENAYAFLGIVNLDIGDNADLEAKVAYAHEYQSGGYKNYDDIGIGAKANFAVGDIKPYVGFDTAISEGFGDRIPWDVGGGLTWNLSDDEKSSLGAHMMMHQPADSGSKLYVALSLKEGDADEGALEGLGAELTVGLDDAASEDNSKWNAKVKAHYKVEGIKPFFDVSFGQAATTAFKAGLELTMIDHLTTTLQYASDDIEKDQGAVTTAVKISY